MNSRQAAGRHEPARIDPRRDFDAQPDAVLFTIAETAAILRLSPNTLKIPKWREDNGLRITKIGRAVRISGGAIRSLLAKGCQKTS